MEHTGTITRAEQYRHGWHIWMGDDYYFVPITDLYLTLRVGDVVSLQANEWGIVAHLEKDGQTIFHHPDVLEQTGTMLKSFMLAANLNVGDLAQRLTYAYNAVNAIVTERLPISDIFLGRFYRAFKETYPQWVSLIANGVASAKNTNSDNTNMPSDTRPD